MSDSPQHSKVTLEDLLRLKRAERPDAEFWNKFERELRQKQLTALLEKRPWWQELPHLLVRRSYLPLGATAILAFTLVSIKYYAPTQLAQVETRLSDSPAVAGEINATTGIPATSPVSSPLLNRDDQAVQRLDDRTALVAMNVEMPADEQSIEVQMPQMVAPKEVETPSARSIAANLARLEQSEPELVYSVVGNRLSSPARVQPAVLQDNDLAAMETSASRRSRRLLARYSDRQLGPEPTAPEIVRERLARRLGDPDIYDRISRLGVRGDAVSLKF